MTYLPAMEEPQGSFFWPITTLLHQGGPPLASSLAPECKHWLWATGRNGDSDGYGEFHNVYLARVSSCGIYNKLSTKVCWMNVTLKTNKQTKKPKQSKRWAFPEKCGRESSGQSCCGVIPRANFESYFSPLWQLIQHFEFQFSNLKAGLIIAYFIIRLLDNLSTQPSYRDSKHSTSVN